MRRKLLHQAEAYVQKNNRRSAWRKCVQAMACIVVFCTTYALILPALTLEKSDQCQLEEHTHDVSCYVKVEEETARQLNCVYSGLNVHKHVQQCYDEQNNLICGLADFIVHEHAASCRDEEGTLVCQIPEVKEHTHNEAECYEEVEVPLPGQGHIHDDSCYVIEIGELTCQNSDGGHTHTSACYTRGENLTCGQQETEGHAHGTDCYQINITCTQPTEAHTHGDGCYETQLLCTLPNEAHVHSASCYETQLVCTLPEDENHTHGIECNTSVLTCTQSTEGHVHTESCSGPVLVCTLPTEPHVHGDACVEKELICAQAEVAAHAHTDACYEQLLTCTQPQGHTHDASCYAQNKTLTCGQEEAEQQFMTTELVLNCDKPEIKVHSHIGPCYEIYLDENNQEQKRLICTEQVVLKHDHTDTCFTTFEVLDETQGEPECGLMDTPAHTHTDACKDASGAVICGLTETKGHQHSELCYGTWELVCEKEEHTHVDSCYDEFGNLICPLEEHTHSYGGDANIGEDEIPLILPLSCKVEEHIHDTQCFGEAAGGEPSCGKIEHTHTAECYGPAIEVFPYEDDQISLTVTVTSYIGLPERMRMEVLLLNAEDQRYTAYEGYAIENSNGELFGLTGYQIQFFYEGREIELADAVITADLTVKPVEYQKAEEPVLFEVITDDIYNLFTTEETFKTPVAMSLLTAEPAADQNTAITESSNETVEEPDAVMITVLQQSDEAVISRGSATFPDAETQNTKITLSLSGNRTFALANEAVTNPEFTVQFYANFPRMLRHTEAEKNAMSEDEKKFLLDIIDTSNGGNYQGGILPSNGVTPTVTYLQLRQVPGVTAGDDKMHSTRGAISGNERAVFEVWANLEQTQVYNNLPFTYSSGMRIENLDKLYENNHYNLVDLWISNDNEKTWTVYTTVPVDSAYVDSPYLIVAPGVEPTKSNNQEVFGQWFHGAGADNDHLWYRKFRQNVGDTATIAIPVDKGDVTHIVRVNDIHDLTFTNNQDNTDPTTIVISEKAIVRLVYDLPRDDQSLPADFYDYDISDNQVYVSRAGTNPPVLEGWTTPDNANDAMYVVNNEGYAQKLYMKTSEDKEAYGINSQAAYHNPSGATAYFAFGNDNTGVFRSRDQLDGNYINQATDNFKGCSFGLIKGLYNDNQPFLQFADGIASQALFNEEIIGYPSSPAKHPYFRQQLVFRRMGDTYILTGVNTGNQGSGVYENLLNQFTSPLNRWKSDIPIFTNNFWPMDGTAGDLIGDRDMMFGSVDAGMKDKERYSVGSDGRARYLPTSDDGLAHNSYFGMSFSVEFQMDGEYCGPLEYLFYGDDDMWVFLTNLDTGKSTQVCDIGGVHSSVGSFTDLWDYIPKNAVGNYRLDFFYTERGASGSSCYMEFTLPEVTSVPHNTPSTGSVTVKKDVPNAKSTEEYTFLFQLTGSQDKFSYQIIEGGNTIKSDSIESGDTFTLKENQSINIWGIPVGTAYTITEQLAQGQDKYNISWIGSDGETIGQSVSGTIENGITHTYTCANEALGSLEVKKTVIGKEGETVTNAAFAIDVILTDANGQPLSGTYGGVTFDTNGKTTVNLKHNETATFTGIPVGSLFTVQEQLPDGYLVKYLLDDEVVKDGNGVTATSASGTIAYNSTVSIEVVNTTGYELPETGGAGTFLYTMVGLTLMTLGVAYLLYNKNRRRGAYESP